MDTLAGITVFEKILDIQDIANDLSGLVDTKAQKSTVETTEENR
jgi:hypothetical protein